MEKLTSQVDLKIVQLEPTRLGLITIQYLDDQSKSCSFKVPLLQIKYFKLFFRADEAEKKRKDLENATNFNDEHIEKSEADLRLSKKTMRETHEKYDETGTKLILFYKQDIMKIVFFYQNCSNLLSTGRKNCSNEKNF